MEVIRQEIFEAPPIEAEDGSWHETIASVRAGANDDPSPKPLVDNGLQCDMFARSACSALKRCEDLVLGAAFLVALVFPMLLIALAIKLTSPGPVIFRQRRCGRGGRVFWIWKFRTMSVCEDGGEVKQCLPGDRRVTALGSFLRRTCLDELPNIINVLLGDMSIVGPRPHPIAMDEEFRMRVPGYSLRTSVKPGMTGLAQISGSRGAAETPEKVHQRVGLDLKYIHHWSLWLDLKVIVATALMIVSGRTRWELVKIPAVPTLRLSQVPSLADSPSPAAASLN
jgi:lipopolysaccharide/colanic/teichoic acid biosynthesis glycosyltransferase